MSDIRESAERGRQVVQGRPDRVAEYDGDELVAAVDAALDCIRYAEVINPSQDCQDIETLLGTMMDADTLNGERLP